MGENKHTMSDLYQMQALPLSAKIRMTERRIYDWIDTFGRDGVYISFSGGKDSTVLMDIVRNRMGYKDIPAVFVDVPTQYPELKQFALTWDNVEVIRPKISFMEVCEKYGFPLISKEVSECVYGARKYLTKVLEQMHNLENGERRTENGERRTEIPYAYWYDRVTGKGKYQKKENIPSNAEILENAHLESIGGGQGTITNAKCQNFLEQIDEISNQNPSGGGTTTNIENSVALTSIAEMMVRGGIEHLANERTQNLLGWRTRGSLHSERTRSNDNGRVRSGLVQEEDGSYP